MKKFLLAIIALLSITYIGGYVYFKDHTYPNTTIDGKHVGLEKIEDLYSVETLEKEFDIKLYEGSESLKMPYDRFVSKDVVFTDALRWPLQIMENHDFESTIEFKNDSFYEKIAELNKMQTKDAEFSIEGNEAKVSEDSYGYNIPEDFEIDYNESEIDFSQYVELPSVTSEDLEERRVKTQAILDNELTLLNKTLTGQDLLALYDENLELDHDKVAEFVETVADETDTLDKHRSFKTSNGRDITLEPGVYGWKLDKDKTIDNLINNPKGEIKASYRTYAVQRDFNNDIGKTYLEVDKENQKLYAYKNGNLLLDTNIVTGYVGKADTPKGVFYIWAKREKATLRARSRVTDERYETPVDYWMPIDWTGVGLHDANWRSNFGGQIYKINGSNGCINLPPAVAKQIFETFDVGTPVVVY